MFSARFLPVALVFAATIMVSCLTENKKDQAGGQVVENELGVGRLYFQNGEPAANAEVLVYSVGHIPNPALGKKSNQQEVVAKVRTDSEGRYRVGGADKGLYNVLASKDGLVVYKDSVFLAPDPTALGSDTLRAPGQLAGIVRLQPNHDPRSATVQVLGTNNYSNVDEDGRFQLVNMAEGKYLLRVITTQPEYTPLFQEIQIQSGDSNELADTLRPVFTGLPIVQGIYSEYDTVKGIVTIRWNKTNYRNLSGYAIYRAPAGSAAIPFQTLNTNRIMDTIYRDATTLTSGSGEILGNYFGGVDSVGRSWEYWVVSQDKNGSRSEPFYSTVITAVPPYLQETQLRIRCLECKDNNKTSINDTLHLEVSWNNPLKLNKRVQWSQGSETVAMRAVEINSKAGKDTLSFVCGKEPETISIKAAVTDEKNRIWSQLFWLGVEKAEPVVSITAPNWVMVGKRFSLVSRIFEPIGKVIKREWDIGNTGRWVEVSSDTVMFKAPDKPSNEFIIHNRVTDDDGNVSTASVTLNIGTSRIFSPKGAEPLKSLRILPVGEKLLAYGVTAEGINVIYEYRPDSDSLVLVTKDKAQGIPYVGGWVLNNTPYFWGFSGEANNQLSRYVENTGKTEVVGPTLLDFNARWGEVYQVGNKLHVFANTNKQGSVQSIRVFDPLNSSWSIQPPPPFSLTNGAVANEAFIYAQSQNYPDYIFTQGAGDSAFRAIVVPQDFKRVDNRILIPTKTDLFLFIARWEGQLARLDPVSEAWGRSEENFPFDFIEGSRYYTMSRDNSPEGDSFYLIEHIGGFWPKLNVYGYNQNSKKWRQVSSIQTYLIPGYVEIVGARYWKGSIFVEFGRPNGIEKDPQQIWEFSISPP